MSDDPSEEFAKFLRSMTGDVLRHQASQGAGAIVVEQSFDKHLDAVKSALSKHENLEPCYACYFASMLEKLGELVGRHELLRGNVDPDFAVTASMAFLSGYNQACEDLNLGTVVRTEGIIASMEPQDNSPGASEKRKGDIAAVDEMMARVFAIKSRDEDED